MRPRRCFFCPSISNLPAAPPSEGLCEACAELLFDFRVYLDEMRRKWRSSFIVTVR